MTYPTPEVPTDYPIDGAGEIGDVPIEGGVNTATLAIRLSDTLADLPPDTYAQVSATWTSDEGHLLTLTLSSTAHSDEETE